MTAYVVDASVVIQELIQDTFTQNVRVLFRIPRQSVQLYIPEFCFVECTNVLWKQVRFRGMPQEEAKALTRDLTALRLSVIPVTNLLPRSLEIGLEHQLAVYDSVYIAVAEKLNSALITVDERQEKAANSMGVNVKKITDFRE